MKTVQRIHQNNGTNRRSSQVQQSRNGSSTQLKTPHTERQVNIAIHEDSGETFASFELPESAFLKLKADAEAKGISLMEWMMKAVESTFGNARPQLPATPEAEVVAQCSLAEELKQAVLRNDVLHQLIEEHLDQRIHRSGANWDDEEYADRFNFGLALLKDDVVDRLKKCSRSIMESAYGKKQESAS